MNEIDSDERPEIVRRIERRQQGVDAFGRARRRLERRFAGIVLGERIGAEVMIEGDVLLEDHHQVLNRRRRLRFYP